jgi:hypothetical protein
MASALGFCSNSSRSGFHARRTTDNVGPIAPNYNVAPGDFHPVIRRSRDTGEREPGDDALGHRALVRQGCDEVIDGLNA